MAVRGAARRRAVTRWAFALAALALAAPAEARRPRRGRPSAEVELDGAVTAVRWIDGDTFRVLGGPRRGRSARLLDYNSLETYGSVHAWGRWSPAELQELARAAGPVAASRRWSCATSGGDDRYGRLLVACPGVAAELVGRGLAMAYGFDGDAPPALLALQREAQRSGRGMWAKGVPRAIPTSLHSADENPDGAAYDRIVDTSTGRAVARPHATSYRTCQLVCAGEDGDRACMVYVPYERRYRGRPGCLRR